MTYEVSIEAGVAVDLVDQGDRLLDELESAADGLEREPTLRGNEDTGQVQVVLTLDAQDGRDAHDAALEVWDAWWEECFGDATSPVLHITAKPVRGRAAARAEEELETADA